MLNLGDTKTKKLTSGRLFVKRTGEDNYRDLGNCMTHKPEFSVSRKDHMKSEGGVKRVDMSLVSEINPKYQFELDEHTPDLTQLILLATQGTDTTQAATNVIAEALTTSAKQGRTYFLAKLGVSAVVVKVGAAVKLLNYDYVVDLGSGAITILNGGGIADGSSVTVDYTAAQVVQHNFTAFKDLRFEGHFKYIETDQFSTVPREITEFDGQCHITNWGENNGDYNKVTLEAIPLNNPTVTTRAD